MGHYKPGLDKAPDRSQQQHCVFLAVQSESRPERCIHEGTCAPPGVGQGKVGAASGKVGVQTTKDREGHILKGRGAAGGSQRRKAGVSRGEKQHPPVGLLAGRGLGRQVIRS